MRNWHPFIADTVAQMKADGVTHARVLCLAPQNSRTSTGLYRRALEAAVGDGFPYDFIAGWADEPLLAQAFAEHLQPALTEARSTHPSAPVLFTAHSVPCRTITAPAQRGCPIFADSLSSAKARVVPPTESRTTAPLQRGTPTPSSASKPPPPSQNCLD